MRRMTKPRIRATTAAWSSPRSETSTMTINDIEALVVQLGGKAYRPQFPGADLFLMLPSDNGVPPISAWWNCAEKSNEIEIAFAAHVTQCGHLYTRGDAAHFVRWLESQGYPVVE